jgi:hypothetical protein
MLAVLLPSLVVAQTKAVSNSQPLVFTHVTLIDRTGAPRWKTKAW